MAGLGTAIDRPFADYSHGMRYRLALAQALLGGPDLLILDEPTTGMDPAQVLEVRKAIATSVAAGATVLLSSHDFSEIELVCTHAAVLRDGRLVASGSMAELVGQRPRIRLGIGTPDRALPVLRAVAGVTRADIVGEGAVLVEGRLRPRRPTSSVPWTPPGSPWRSSAAAPSRTPISHSSRTAAVLTTSHPRE